MSVNTYRDNAAEAVTKPVPRFLRLRSAWKRVGVDTILISGILITVASVCCLWMSAAGSAEADRIAREHRHFSDWQQAEERWQASNEQRTRELDALAATLAEKQRQEQAREEMRRMALDELMRRAGGGR